MKLVWALLFLSLSFGVALAKRPPADENQDPRLNEAIRAFQVRLKDEKDETERRRINRILTALKRFANPITLNANGRMDCDGDIFQMPAKLELQQDTIIKCREIRIPHGSFVSVRHGVALFLDAEMIVVEGEATINGTGEPGSPGRPGRSIEGSWQSQGDSDYWAALNGCRSNPKHPERGEDGGPGGRGGDGAIIVFSTKPSKRTVLNVIYDGGVGGQGGPGGQGRLLRNGRNYYCDGCTMNCPSGNTGQQGLPGTKGDYIILE